MSTRARTPAWAVVLGTLTLIGVADTSWAAVTTTRVSVSTAGAQNRASDAGSVVAGDINGQCDVFVRCDGL
jgi:hypothetical protein